MGQSFKADDFVLDRPGSAGPGTLRRTAIVVTVIVGLAVVTMVAGRNPLPAYPQFTVFHVTFVFVVDLVTAFLVFGQFLYCRALSYLPLAAAFLFSALTTLPFLLSFPEALGHGFSIMGGAQSSIWVWHVWHVLFPGIIGVSVAIHRFGSRNPVQRTGLAITSTVTLVVIAVSALSVGVTVFHDRLPVLYAQTETPLTAEFYKTGAIAAAVILVSLWLTLPEIRKRSLLHIWIAMVLLASLAEVGASLSAHDRYTVGWYFGRIDGMLASTVLLAVFLSDAARLYRNLANTVRELSAAHGKKDQLLAEVRRRQQEFEALVERAPDIIVRLDLQGRIRYINPAIERITGRRREWFEGRGPTELGMPIDVAERREHALARLLETGQEQVFEHHLTVLGGTRYFQVRLTPEFGCDGRVESALAIERDITELKKAQLELEQLTVQDPLTGIGNRRYFEQFIDREWRLEARHRHPVAIIMADIDHFKAYNDHYGHPQGDACLRAVAQVLLLHFRRPGDLLARYGGEEFAAVLLETELPKALRLAETTCRAVSDQGLAHAASPVAPVVTISMGVAAAPAHRCSYPQLLAAADRALYRAKRDGRNRVEGAEPEFGCS